MEQLCEHEGEVGRGEHEQRLHRLPLGAAGLGGDEADDASEHDTNHSTTNNNKEELKQRHDDLIGSNSLKYYFD